MTRPFTTALSVEGVPVAVLALLEPDVDVDAARLLLGEGQVCGGDQAGRLTLVIQGSVKSMCVWSLVCDRNCGRNTFGNIFECFGR